ncbi:MAG: hypothetical protein O8C58_06530 [Candidatus Methanoperedens sp.]|nr:hypothetical protein [Candidatus Methanoperedens sp.]
MNNIKLGFVVSEFNRDITSQMEALGKEHAKFLGASVEKVLYIQHASRKIADLALENNKPITLGISGPGMSRLDAHERVEYAKSAVEAAVKMVKRLRE